MTDSPVKYAFVLPGVLTMIAIVIFPVGYAIRLSLSSWEISAFGSGMDFAGLTQYARVLQDVRFWHSLFVTFVIVFFAVSLEYVIGLSLALILTVELRGRRAFRVIFLVPMMVTAVVMALVWRTVLHESIGPINDILIRLSLPGIPWLSHNTIALISIILVDFWQWTPFMFIILLAGLLSLPQDPYEAAVIDGASSWQIFRYITFELLYPVSVAVLLIRTIEAFKIMGTIFVLTSGGPGTSTESSSYYIWIRGLKEFQLGYSAAMAFTYLIILTIGLIIFSKLLRKRISTRER
jgi:multiple sugar transport system permease protein